MEDPGVDGRIILRWIFRKWDVGGMEWIELAQDRDRWRGLVNNNNNNNNNNNLLQLGCYPVTVVILHVYKI